ncbi:prolyl endopeptidase-like isoform X2 [Gouania willdenowi]|uniref:Prolyl endopeptidase n=1 Tax=Gouania willdenowi TaxID=441366 RepID=A0A8C5H577_GOUWI|nr:prolyl endopeptidase-like isoform X2 [Gouania willdenowi]
MAALWCLHCSSVRLFTSSHVAVYKLLTGFTSRFLRRYTSETSAVDFSSGLERYKDLQNVFRRRLKATYQRFSNIADQSVVCGHHYVYLIQSDGIYRVDRLQSELKPQLVLDLGHFSGGHEETGVEKDFYWTVQRVRLSPQEKHLAATIACHDRVKLRCVIVRLEGGDFNCLDSQSIIASLGEVFSFEWATDEVMFYTTLEGVRSNKAFRLDLTSSGSRITCVYEETQPDVFVEVALSRDRHILTINCNSRTSSEVLFSDVTTPNSFSVVQPRQENLLYHVEHWRGKLLMLANTGPGHEYQVVQVPISDTSMAAWVPVFTPDPGTVIKDMEIVGDHCVLSAKTPSCHPHLIVVPLKHPKEAYVVQLPSWTCAIESRKPGLADQQDLIQFLISSPFHPPLPFCLYPERGLLLSGTEEGSSLDNQDRFITTRLEACSRDGTLVPMTLLHSVPLEHLRQAPLLVHVYGAYGRDLNMDFCPVQRLLLELGWTLAYCHIRGGGERGLSWHRQGCVKGKQRGVEDLQACLQYIFSSSISSPSLTALTACSAGAVPVGALCNSYPHLMKAVTLQAPFLDVLGSMKDPSLPLTLEDRDEWGDPVGNSEHRHCIATYCPLYNIKPQLYPSVLLTAYSSDPRVPLTGVLRYSERLRRAIHDHQSKKPQSDCDLAPNVVLNIQPGSNHLGPEDFELMLDEEALKLAFLYTEFGLAPPRKTKRFIRTNRDQ